MSSANIGPVQVNKNVIQKAYQQPQQLQDEEPNWDIEGIDPYVISSEKTSKPFSSSVAISKDPGQCRSGRKKIQMDNNNNEVPSCPVMECAKEVQANLNAQFPSLIKLMLQSHVTRGFWLGLPAEFCKMHLPSYDEIVILEDESGEEYETKFLAIKRGLSGGWSGFAQSHKLLEGDAVVFHLVRSCKFKVYIVRSTNLREVDGAIALLNLQRKGTGRDYGIGLNKILREKEKEKGDAPEANEEKKKSAAETLSKTAKQGAPSPTKIVEWQPRRKSQKFAVLVDGQTEKGGTLSGFELVHFDKQGKSGNIMSSQAPRSVPFSERCMTTVKEASEQDKLVEYWAGNFYPDWKPGHNAKAQNISHAKKFIDLSVFSRDQEFTGQYSDLEVDKQLFCSSLQNMVFGQESLHGRASLLKSIQEVEDQLVIQKDRVIELESQIELMQKSEEQVQMKLKDKADQTEKASSEGAKAANKLKEACKKMNGYKEHFQAVQASLKEYETDDGLLNPSIVKDLNLRFINTPLFKRILKDILKPCFGAGFTMAVDMMKKSHPNVKLPDDILQEYYEPSAINTNVKVPWQKRDVMPEDFADDDFEEKEEDEEGGNGSACYDDIGPSERQNELPLPAVSNPIDVLPEQSETVNPTGDGEIKEILLRPSL